MDPQFCWHPSQLSSCSLSFVSPGGTICLYLNRKTPAASAICGPTEQLRTSDVRKIDQNSPKNLNFRIEEDPFDTSGRNPSLLPTPSLSEVKNCVAAKVDVCKVKIFAKDGASLQVSLRILRCARDLDTLRCWQRRKWERGTDWWMTMKREVNDKARRKGGKWGQNTRDKSPSIQGPRTPTATLATPTSHFQQI